METEGKEPPSCSAKELERSHCLEDVCLNPTSSNSQAVDAATKICDHSVEQEGDQQRHQKDQQGELCQQQQQQQEQQHRHGKKEKHTKGGKKRSPKKCQENLEETPDSIKRKRSHSRHEASRQKSKSEIEQLTPAQRAYWQRQLPDGFDYYLGSFACSVIKSQPSNILEFFSEFTEELLRIRNSELAKLPTRSYLDQLHQKKFGVPGTSAKQSTSVDSALAEGQDGLATGTGDQCLELDPPTIHSSDGGTETPGSDVTDLQGAAHEEEYVSSQQTWFTAKQTASDQTAQAQDGSSCKFLDTDRKSPEGSSSLRGMTSRDISLDLVEKGKMSSSCSIGSLVEGEEVVHDSDAAASSNSGHLKPEFTFVNIQAQAKVTSSSAEKIKDEEPIQDFSAYLHHHSANCHAPEVNSIDKNMYMKCPEVPGKIQEDITNKLGNEVEDSTGEDNFGSGLNNREAGKALGSGKDEVEYRINLGTIEGVPFHIALTSETAETLHLSEVIQSLGENNADPEITHCTKEVMGVSNEEGEDVLSELNISEDGEERLDSEPVTQLSTKRENSQSDDKAEPVPPRYRSVKEIIKQFKLSESKGQAFDRQTEQTKLSVRPKETSITSTEKCINPSEKQSHFRNKMEEQSKNVQKHSPASPERPIVSEKPFHCGLQNVLSKKKQNQKMELSKDEKPSTSAVSTATRDEHGAIAGSSGFIRHGTQSQLARAAVLLWRSKAVGKRESRVSSLEFGGREITTENAVMINKEDCNVQKVTVTQIEKDRTEADTDNVQRDGSKDEYQKGGTGSFRSKREALEKVFKERLRTNSTSGNPAKIPDNVQKLPIGRKDNTIKNSKESEQQPWTAKKLNKYQWEEKPDVGVNKDVLKRQWNVTNFQLYNWIEREEKNSLHKRGRQISENNASDAPVSKKVLPHLNDRKMRLLRTGLGGRSSTKDEVIDEKTNVVGENNQTNTKAFGVEANSAGRKQQIQILSSSSTLPKAQLPFLSELAKSKVVLSANRPQPRELEETAGNKHLPSDTKNQPRHHTLSGSKADTKLPEMDNAILYDKACKTEKSDSEAQMQLIGKQANSYEVNAKAENIRELHSITESNSSEIITRDSQELNSDQIESDVQDLSTLSHTGTHEIKTKAEYTRTFPDTALSHIPESVTSPSLDVRLDTRKTKEEKVLKTATPAVLKADITPTLKQQKPLSQIDIDVASGEADLSNCIDISSIDHSKTAMILDHGIRMDIVETNCDEKHRVCNLGLEADHLGKETDNSESSWLGGDKHTQSETKTSNEDSCSLTESGKDRADAEKALKLVTAYVENLEKVTAEVESVYRQRKSSSYSINEGHIERSLYTLGSEEYTSHASETKNLRKPPLSEKLVSKYVRSRPKRSDSGNKTSVSLHQENGQKAFNNATDVSSSESIISVPGLFDLPKSLLNDIARAVLMVGELNQDKEYNTAPQVCLRFVGNGVVFKIQPALISSEYQVSEVFQEAGTSNVSVGVQESDSLISQCVASIGDGGTNHEDTGSINREKITNQARRNVALRRALNQAAEEKGQDGKSITIYVEKDISLTHSITSNTNEEIPNNPTASGSGVVENIATKDKLYSECSESNVDLNQSKQSSCGIECMKKEVDKNGNNRRIDKTRCELRVVKEYSQRDRKKSSFKIPVRSSDNTKMSNRYHPMHNHYKVRRPSLLPTYRPRDMSNNSNNTREGSACTSIEPDSIPKRDDYNRYMVEGLSYVNSNRPGITPREEPQTLSEGLYFLENASYFQKQHGVKIALCDGLHGLGTATPVLCTNQLTVPNSAHSVNQALRSNHEATNQVQKQPPPTRWMFKSEGMLGISGQATTCFTNEPEVDEILSVPEKSICNEKNSICDLTSMQFKGEIPSFGNLVKGKFHAKHPKSFTEFKKPKWLMGRQMSASLKLNTNSPPMKIEKHMISSKPSIDTETNGLESPQTQVKSSTQSLNKQSKSSPPTAPIKSRSQQDPAYQDGLSLNLTEDTPTPENKAKEEWKAFLSNPVETEKVSALLPAPSKVRSDKEGSHEATGGYLSEPGQPLSPELSRLDMEDSKPSFYNIDGELVTLLDSEDIDHYRGDKKVRSRNWAEEIDNDIDPATYLMKPVRDYTNSNNESHIESVCKQPSFGEKKLIERRNNVFFQPSKRLRNTGDKVTEESESESSRSHNQESQNTTSGDTSTTSTSATTMSTTTTTTTTATIDTTSDASLSNTTQRKRTQSRSSRHNGNGDDSTTSRSGLSKDKSIYSGKSYTRRSNKQRFIGGLRDSGKIERVYHMKDHLPNEAVYKSGSKLIILRDKTKSSSKGMCKPDKPSDYHNTRNGIEIKSGSGNCTLVSRNETKETAPDSCKKKITIADRETSKQPDGSMKDLQEKSTLPGQNGSPGADLSTEVGKLNDEILAFAAEGKNQHKDNIQDVTRPSKNKLNTSKDKESNSKENLTWKGSDLRIAQSNRSMELGDTREGEIVSKGNSQSSNYPEIQSPKKFTRKASRKDKGRNEKSRLTVRRSSLTSPVRKSSPQFAYEARGSLVKSDDYTRRWPLQDMTINTHKQSSQVKKSKEETQSLISSNNKSESKEKWFSWNKLFWWGYGKDEQSEISPPKKLAPDSVIEFPLKLREITKESLEETEEVTRVLTLEEPEKNVYVNTTFERQNPRRAITSAPFEVSHDRLRVYQIRDVDGQVPQYSTSPPRCLICEPEAFTEKNVKHDRKQLILENGTSLHTSTVRLTSAAPRHGTTSRDLALPGLPLEGVTAFGRETRDMNVVEPLSPTIEYTLGSPKNVFRISDSVERSNRDTEMNKSPPGDKPNPKTGSCQNQIVANRNVGETTDFLELQVIQSQREKLNGTGRGRDRFYEEGQRVRKSPSADSEDLISKVHRSLEVSVSKSKEKTPVWLKRPEVCKIGDTIVIGGTQNWSGFQRESTKFRKMKKVRSLSASPGENIYSYSPRFHNKNNSKPIYQQKGSIFHCAFNTDSSGAKDSETFKNCFDMITVDLLNFNDTQQIPEVSQRYKPDIMNEAFGETFTANTQVCIERNNIYLTEKSSSDGKTGLLPQAIIHSNNLYALYNLNNHSNYRDWQKISDTCEICCGSVCLCERCRQCSKDPSGCPKLREVSGDIMERAKQVLESLKTPSRPRRFDFCYNDTSWLYQRETLVERCISRERKRERQSHRKSTCRLKNDVSKSEDRRRFCRDLEHAEGTNWHKRGWVSRSVDRWRSNKNFEFDWDEECVGRDGDIDCEDVVVCPCPEKRDGKRVWKCRILTQDKSSEDACCDEEESVSSLGDEECTLVCSVDDTRANVCAPPSCYETNKVLNIVLVCREEIASQRKDKKRTSSDSKKSLTETAECRAVQTSDVSFEKADALSIHTVAENEQPVTPTNTPRNSTTSSQEPPDKTEGDAHKDRHSVTSGDRELGKVHHEVSLGSLGSPNLDFSAESLSGAGPLPLDLLPLSNKPSVEGKQPPMVKGAEASYLEQELGEDAKETSVITISERMPSVREEPQTPEDVKEASENTISETESSAKEGQQTFEDEKKAFDYAKETFGDAEERFNDAKDESDDEKAASTTTESEKMSGVRGGQTTSEAGSDWVPYDHTDISEFTGTFGIPLDGGGYLDPAYAVSGGKESEVVDAASRLPPQLMVDTAYNLDKNFGPNGPAFPPRSHNTSNLDTPKSKDYHLVRHVDTDTGAVRSMVVRRESITVTSDQGLKSFIDEKDQTVSGDSLKTRRREKRKYFKGDPRDKKILQEKDEEDQQQEQEAEAAQ